jgi:hypothetical protein
VDPHAPRPYAPRYRVETDGPYGMINPDYVASA